MKRNELPPNKTASFVLPRWKTVYISVPKAGCTSLKWLIAELQGESQEHFSELLSMETSRRMLIHHRYQWRHTPMLRLLSDEDLEDISPERGWFMFAVVRHPSSRIFSGWQSKWLLREPRFRELFPDHDLWPPIPSTTSDVVDGFEAFVQRLRDAPDDPVFQDRHFRPQTVLLRDDVAPYSRIYRTSQMGELIGDLETHLRSLGLESMPPLQRNNETPLRPLRSMFSTETLKTIGAHYACDFDRYGFDDALPPKLSSDEAYTDDALAEVGRLVERSERILDLYKIGFAAREREKRSSRKLARLRAQQAERTPTAGAVRLGQVRSLLGRVRRRLLTPS